MLQSPGLRNIVTMTILQQPCGLSTRLLSSGDLVQPQPKEVDDELSFHNTKVEVLADPSDKPPAKHVYTHNPIPRPKAVQAAQNAMFTKYNYMIIESTSPNRLASLLVLQYRSFAKKEGHWYALP